MTISARLTTHCGLAALALVLAGTAAAHAQSAAQYPSKRMNLVVGFAAGGFADTLARTVGQKLQDKWGQPVTVENRAGAGGNTAATFVANAAPDGHTILVTTTALAINETLYKHREYQLDQLTAVAMPASSAESLAVHPSKPGTMREFLDWAKGREITFGSAGVGSGSHIAAEYFFKILAKTKANHVPFRGGALSVQAGVGNQIDVVASSFGSAAQVNEGKLKGLAVAGMERSVAMPQVPTFRETGFKDFVAESWVGLFVPAKTDPAIVEKLNAAVNEIVSEEQTRQRLTGLGYQLSIRPATESNKYLASEVQNWGTMVKAIDLTVD